MYVCNTPSRYKKSKNEGWGKPGSSTNDQRQSESETKDVKTDQTVKCVCCDIGDWGKLLPY